MATKKRSVRAKRPRDPDHGVAQVVAREPEIHQVFFVGGPADGTYRGVSSLKRFFPLADARTVGGVEKPYFYRLDELRISDYTFPFYRFADLPSGSATAAEVFLKVVQHVIASSDAAKDSAPGRPAFQRRRRR